MVNEDDIEMILVQRVINIDFNSNLLNIMNILFWEDIVFYIKKCITVVLLLICTIATVSAYEGRVGGDIEYTRYLNSDITEVESWGGI